MAKNDEGYLMGDGFIAKWAKVWRYVSGMMKAVIPGGKNTPDGPVFADLRSGGNFFRPMTGVNTVLVQIVGTSTAGVSLHGGKYDAYIMDYSGLGSGTSSARIGGTNNVDLDPTYMGLTRGEQVIAWNTFEESDYNSGTDTHFLHDGSVSANFCALGLASGVRENVGTNTRQIVFVTTLTSFACDL